MENIKKILCFFSLLSFLVINFSCEKEDPIGEESANTAINNWILGNMKIYYFWNEYIPSKTDKNLYPEDYFNSLLYKSEDRFSWIQENFTDLLDLLSGIEMEAGYNYSLGRISTESPDLMGIINYIKPNSPASKTQLKRGDIFSAINGTRITVSNYGNLLDALSSTHTLGIVDDCKLGFDPVRNITLPVIRYEENPVFLDTLYNIAGKKIGYLVYNFFAEDNGDNSITYAKELNNLFGKFKTAGIDELILDLRYNGGGALTTSSELASMISNRKGTDMFCIMQYNKIVDEALKKEAGANYNIYYFADHLGQNIPVNKLTGLNRLFVITSERTASASEALINGLKAYMEVILIGDITYGKNVGSITIYEEDKEKQKTNQWGMQPIVVKIANAEGFSGFGNGFEPDVKQYERLPFLPLGDTNEDLLQAVLVKIGVMQAPEGLRANNKNAFIPVFSSMDRTPVRRNTYIQPEKLRIK
jgi:C-terminal processing protease CtpA/Prc